MKNKIKMLNMRFAEMLDYGFKKKQNIYPVELFQNEEFLNQKHIFFLSTGRCGTMYFTTLLNQFSEVKAFHEPLPTLATQAQFAWKMQNQNDFHESLRAIFIAARENQMHKTFEYGFRYAETNNFLTFFAPILQEMFPNAKFAHIVRHPGEFVRSAIRRKYYTGEHHYDSFRITPLENDVAFSEWDDFSAIQKNAWLWNATNQFAEKFCKSVENSRFFRFNFNLRSEKTIRELFEFLELGNEQVKINLRKKLNAQKTGDFPKFSEWNSVQKNELRKICGNLSDRYNYNLT